MSQVTVAMPVDRCDSCHYVETTRTPNAGFAYDYYCTKFKPARLITSYVEYNSELNSTPPIWCPFATTSDIHIILKDMLHCSDIHGPNCHWCSHAVDHKPTERCSAELMEQAFKTFNTLVNR